MNKIPLTNIFLYEFFIDEKLVDDSLAQFLAIEKTKFVPANSKEQSNLDANAIYPLDNDNKILPIYHSELFSQIQNCLDEVAKIHFTADQKLVICDSWITKAFMGQRGTWHTHQLSFISGLLYMTDHNKSETLFYLNDPFYDNHSKMFLPIIQQQEYIIKVKPQKGKLLLWDSTIGHKLSPNTDMKTRYTLAFNSFVTGKICDKPTMVLSLDCRDVKQQSNIIEK